MEYMILTEETPKDLETAVNDALKGGWLFHGELIVSPGERGMRQFHQAMVRMTQDHAP